MIGGVEDDNLGTLPACVSCGVRRTPATLQNAVDVGDR